MDADIAHPHCEKCYKRKCIERLWPPDGCGMVDCDYDCGARFHACKKREHSLLCPSERVNCLNCENGCPLVLPRWQLGVHLETCPASVVICTMEWNRWPVYSRERQTKLPFTQHQMHLRYGQLDVALAMRDQRMLNESMKAPRQTRRTLRNNLTRRFPAVPIVYHRGRPGEIDTDPCTSADTSRTVSDDDSDAPWEKAKMPPGLQRSMCSKLYRATKQATDSLSQAIEAAIDKPNDGMLSNIPEFSDAKNGERVDETLCYKVDIEGAGKMCNYDEISCDVGMTSADLVAGELDYRKSLSMSPPPVDASLEFPPSDSIPSNAPMIPTPPDLSLFLSELLGLDLNLESITRYQAKPRSMYTFLCLQEFRRDEYSSHFQNVHGNIQCGLNGWMEQRCPLSQYGCTHSIRRFYPKPGGRITHSSLLESFGLQPQSTGTGILGDIAKHELSKSSSCESFGSRERTPDVHSTQRRSPSKSKESTPEVFTSQKYNSGVDMQKKNSQVASPTNGPVLSLTTLPFEVLRYITRFLDGFSLNNLSLTCHLLRDVCSSMLEERGIVAQQWERVKDEGRNRWLVSYQRWTFSVCFSAIQDWGFADHEPLGEHLKVCPFNKRNAKTEPYRFPMGCDTLSEEIVQKLYQSAAQDTLMTDPSAGAAIKSGDQLPVSEIGSTFIEVEKGRILNPPDQICQGCSEEERRKSADLNQAIVDNATFVA